MRKLRIVIGFFVAIPVIVIAVAKYFLSSCLKKYTDWLNLRAIHRAAEDCRKRSYKASGLR